MAAAADHQSLQQLDPEVPPVEWAAAGPGFAVWAGVAAAVVVIVVVVAVAPVDAAESADGDVDVDEAGGDGAGLAGFAAAGSPAIPAASVGGGCSAAG